MADSGDKVDLAGWLQLFSPNSKSGLKRLTVGLGVMMGLFWYLAFIQELSWLASPSWWFAPVAAVVLGFGSVLLFSDDKLYYDNTGNAYARAFQKSFPSAFIAARLELSPKDARNLWFQYFNCLRNPKHPNHDQWRRTFQRGYQCRLVYFFICMGAFIFWLSIATLAAEMASRYLFRYELLDPSSLGRRLTFTSIIGILWLIVRLKNRPSLDRPTGVWRRFEEINELNIAWAEANIPELQAQATHDGEEAAECQDPKP